MEINCHEIENGTFLLHEWGHTSVAIVSGSFRRLSSRSRTPEAEAYALVTSVPRMAHISAACGELSLFTTHKDISNMRSST